ncbi:MAG: hypothetical protein JNL70_15785 [Saprospiraceae bacterium]|nr:hypothetical protein [Saprospiraceae bacterium]
MKQKLIVEGHNDILVISHLLMAKNLRITGYNTKERYEKEFVSIGTGKSNNDGGKENALKAFKAALKTEELDRIGLVVDADSETANPAIDTWRSIRNILQQNGYQNLPAEPNPSGTIIAETDKALIGVWIMPNNDSEGYLEHFFEGLINPNDEFLEEARRITEGFVSDERNRFSPTHQQKAKIRTWLAWQDDPESPMGLALRDYPRLGYMSLDTPLVESFYDWLQLCFDTYVE